MAKKKVQNDIPDAAGTEALSGLNLKVRKKELTWIIGVMFFLLVVILLTSYLTKSSNSFTYQTLRFDKQLYGTVPVYVYGYTFKDITGAAVQEYRYQLLLRLDPRKNDVPVEGEIVLNQYGRDIMISVNTTGFESCQTTSRDFASLSGFLTGNLFNVQGGVPDKNVANELNFTHITCSLYPDKTVLEVQSSGKTSIRKISNTCYHINIANCETLNAVEKFEVQSLIDAKKRKSS